MEKEIYKIDITPFQIWDKNNETTLMISSTGKYKRFDSAPLKNFEDFDYLFVAKMIGKGFTQFDYVKMNADEIKKYFPKRKEPKDLFSRFAGTSLFPNKQNATTK